MFDPKIIEEAEAALSMTRPEGVFTATEFSEYRGVSTKTALKTLTAWKEEGYVECVGRIKSISPLTGFTTSTVGYRFKTSSEMKKKKK